MIIKEWRAQYKDLSQEIREMKKEIKTSSQPRMATLQWKKHLLRVRARIMMKELMTFKETIREPVQ